MKGMLLALSTTVGGAAVGAVGTASYKVFLSDVPVAAAVETEASPDDATGEPSALEATTVSARPSPPQTAESEAEPPGETPTADEPAQNQSTPAAALLPVTVAPAEPDPDSLARAAVNHQRLGRIFAAMKPEEAASVLVQLADSELEGILMAMPERNAAPILAEMDPERAASLSRLVLGGNE